MGYNIELFQTCSKAVQDAYTFLIKSHEDNLANLRELVRKIESGSLDEKDAGVGLKELKKRLEMEFDSLDSEFVYVLSKIGSSYVDRYLQLSREDDFMDPPFGEKAYRFRYMLDLGIDGNTIYEYAKQTVMADGALSLNDDEHAPLLRFFVKFNPQSKETQAGLRYWLEKWERFASKDRFGITDVAQALMALYDYNHETMNEQIAKHTKYLISNQKDDGSFSRHSSSGSVENTARCLSALSLVLEPNNEVLLKGKAFLLSRFNEADSDNGRPKFTYMWQELPVAIIALIDLGEGPKAPIAKYEREITKLNYTIGNIRPQFIQTLPTTNNRTLHNKVVEMITSAQKEILIASPFINTLYENLVDKIQENPNMSIKIVTRPRKDYDTELRSRIGKNVLEILNISTKNSLRVSELIHSRMIIVDSNQMIVSSADLTREQLVDEFNAGLYTQDNESIKKAVEFFQTLFNLADELPQDKEKKQ